MDGHKPLIELSDLKLFIAVPLDPNADPGDVFRSPNQFHIVCVDYETASAIGNSVFSKLAFESIDNYPIEPFEDPQFEPEDILTLLECLEKWSPVPDSNEEKAFHIVKDLLIEAKGRGTGIYFKF